MFVRVGVFILVFRIACYCFPCNNLCRVHELSSVWSGDCAFSASFVRGFIDESYVAGEGVVLTIHKESVVVEEIKEAELMRSRRAQFIYDRHYNRIGLQPRDHPPSRRPLKIAKTSVTEKEKVRVFAWKGIGKNIISYYSSTFTINPQPRRRRLRSIASCLP